MKSFLRSGSPTHPADQLTAVAVGNFDLMKHNDECLSKLIKSWFLTAPKRDETRLGCSENEKTETNPIGRRKRPQTGLKCCYSSISQQPKNYQRASVLLYFHE